MPLHPAQQLSNQTPAGPGPSIGTEPDDIAGLTHETQTGKRNRDDRSKQAVHQPGADRWSAICTARTPGKRAIAFRVTLPPVARSQEQNPVIQSPSSGLLELQRTSPTQGNAFLNLDNSRRKSSAHSTGDGGQASDRPEQTADDRHDLRFMRAFPWSPMQKIRSSERRSSQASAPASGAAQPRNAARGTDPEGQCPESTSDESSGPALRLNQAVRVIETQAMQPFPPHQADRDQQEEEAPFLDHPSRDQLRWPAASGADPYPPACSDRRSAVRFNGPLRCRQSAEARSVRS